MGLGWKRRANQKESVCAEKNANARRDAKDTSRRSVVGFKYVYVRIANNGIARENELRLEISNGKLRIDLGDLERALAIRGGFEIPLENIVKVGTEAHRTGWKETRAPGTHLPGAIKAGTYYTPRGKEFWYVTEKGVLVLELENEPYKRIVLSIDGNEEWAERIKKATSK